MTIVRNRKIPGCSHIRGFLVTNSHCFYPTLLVIGKTMLCQLFVLRARFAIVCIRINADAATWRKDARYLNVLRLH